MTAAVLETIYILAREKANDRHNRSPLDIVDASK